MLSALPILCGASPLQGVYAISAPAPTARRQHPLPHTMSTTRLPAFRRANATCARRGNASERKLPASHATVSVPKVEQIRVSGRTDHVAQAHEVVDIERALRISKGHGQKVPLPGVEIGHLAHPNLDHLVFRQQPHDVAMKVLRAYDQHLDDRGDEPRAVRSELYVSFGLGPVHVAKRFRVAVVFVGEGDRGEGGQPVFDRLAITCFSLLCGMRSPVHGWATSDSSREKSSLWASMAIALAMVSTRITRRMRCRK